MSAFWIVEHLDVIEDVSTCFFPICVDFSSNAFALEQFEEALGDRVVVAVATSARARDQVVAL